MRSMTEDKKASLRSWLEAFVVSTPRNYAQKEGSFFEESYEEDSREAGEIASYLNHHQ